MTAIQLEALRHSYLNRPESEADWALKQIDIEWADGGAYALLGPSGCGKTTLLNIISGLLKPSQGRTLFVGRDVTELAPEARNIAQVFQFPVVYDTMTVFDNLAFPLRNRGMARARIEPRVREIATMLDLEDRLSERARNLTADGKQKISLGRGLVRADVNAILLDEPLTVIDPHLKWRLRSKLKELHQKTGATMIYVTHDQTEALTFADQVVVMLDGRVVQVGTPVELFERPKHTFVGHFIGSPGMNVLACEADGSGGVRFAGHEIETENRLDGYAGARGVASSARLEIGVRPEFVSFAEPGGIPVEIVKVADAGRFQIVDTRHEGISIKLLLGGDEPLPGDNQAIGFDPAHTRIYSDGWLVESGGGAGS